MQNTTQINTGGTTNKRKQGHRVPTDLKQQILKRIN